MRGLFYCISVFYSCFENGKILTPSSVSKIFRALDILVDLEVVGVGKVPSDKPGQSRS